MAVNKKGLMTKQIANGNYLVNLSIPLKLTNLDDNEQEVKEMVLSYLHELYQDEDLSALKLTIKKMKKVKRKGKK